MAEQLAHFSLTSGLYDKCNIDKKNQESEGPFKYMTSKVRENQGSCWQNSSPFMHNHFNFIPSSNIDIESDLRNQTRQLTRCPEGRFDPTKLDNCKNCKNCDTGLPCDCGHCKQTKYESKLKECDTGLIPSYTRVNKPCNIFSGININRFHPLCDDIQDTNKIHSNGYIGASSRNLVKDAFKKSQKGPLA
jgi:hypothetical protein